MSKCTVTAKTYALGLLALAAGEAAAQDFPIKPIRILTADAGGGNDLAARLIAQGIAGSLGQNVIVENRPANIAGEFVAKAPHDGYILLLTSSSFIVAPLMQKVPYDPVSDFLAISLATTSPNVLVVHPSVPAKSVKDLVALAKARPGELNYGSGPNGTSSHLAAELFKAMAGINIVRISYKGGGPAVNALIAGEVQVMLGTTGTTLPHVRTGRLRALAVTSAEMSPLAPGLPTVTAAGVPGYQSVSFNGLFAPARTPAVVINRINQELVRFLKTPEARERLLNAGMDPVASSPEQFAAMIKSEMATMGKVIRDAGIRTE